MELVYNNILSFNLENFIKEISQDVKDILVSVKHESNTLHLFVSDTITTEQSESLSSFVQNHNSTPTSPYRVLKYVNEDFCGYPIENIDFVRHLKKDKSLNKKITMLPNGRPLKAEYFFGSELIAEIVFTFQVNSENLILKKDQHLFYHREDSTTQNPNKSDAILIKTKTFNHLDLVDGGLVLEERVSSRKYIINSMKSFLAGVLMQALQKTLTEIIPIIKPFWDEYERERIDFIELGLHDWKNELINIDLQTTPHTYLSINVAPNVTIRDYIVQCLTY